MGPSRRQVLRAGIAAAGVTVVGACSTGGAGAGGSAGPTGGPTTYVLVGGSATPSFYWMPVVQEMARRGRIACPVELSGHGLDADFTPYARAADDPGAFWSAPSAVQGKKLDDYSDDVLDVLKAVRANGPVVLVGHSLGGPIVTRTADRAPELVDHLVYVSAVAVTAAGSALAAVASPLNQGSLISSIPQAGRPAADRMITRSDLRSDDPAFLDAFRNALMGDIEPDRFPAALNYLQQPDESILPTLENVAPDPARWGRIPRTFVRLTGDRWHMPALQDDLVSKADAVTPDNRFAVREIDGSHAGFVVTRTREFADILSAIRIDSPR